MECSAKPTSGCRRFRLIASVLILIGAEGCRFLPFETELTIVVPPLPPGAAGLVSDEARLIVEDGGANSSTRGCRAGETLSLSLVKSEVVAVTVEYAAGVPPAGGVLPEDADGTGRLTLRFEAGLGAAVLGYLAGEGIPIACINYPRLRDYLISVSDGNPWRLDERRIRLALYAGSFSSRDVALLPEYRLPAGALPDGQWLPANPLSAPLFASEEAVVSLGRWTYFGVQGTTGVLWCDEWGWRFYSPDGSIDRRGSWQD